MASRLGRGVRESGGDEVRSVHRVRHRAENGDADGAAELAQRHDERGAGAAALSRYSGESGGGAGRQAQPEADAGQSGPGRRQAVRGARTVWAPAALAHLRRVSQRFEGVLGEAVRGLLVDTTRDEELSGLLQAQVGRLSSETKIAVILRRAAERGEIDPGLLTPRVVALPLDLLRNGVVVRGTPVPDASVVGIIDEVVLPLLRGPRPAR